MKAKVFFVSKLNILIQGHPEAKVLERLSHEPVPCEVAASLKPHPLVSAACICI